MIGRLVSRRAICASAVATFFLAAAAGPARAIYLDEIGWIPGTYALSDYDLGPPVETLEISSGNIATFRLTGIVNATFTIGNPGNVTDIFPPSPPIPPPPWAFYFDYNLHAIESVSWDPTAYPYITVFPAGLGGGLAVGSAPGRDGDFFSFYQSKDDRGQIFADLDTPEPSTWVMLLLGFTGLAWTARRGPSRIAIPRLGVGGSA
jgi:hypothetical protein